MRNRADNAAQKEVPRRRTAIRGHGEHSRRKAVEATAQWLHFADIGADGFEAVLIKGRAKARPAEGIDKAGQEDEKEPGEPGAGGHPWQGLLLDPLAHSYFETEEADHHGAQRKTAMAINPDDFAASTIGQMKLVQEVVVAMAQATGRTPSMDMRGRGR